MSFGGLLTLMLKAFIVSRLDWVEKGVFQGDCVAYSNISGKKSCS